MEEVIIKMVEDYHKKTNGKCGLPSTVIFLQHKNKKDVKAALNSLVKSQKIKVRKGVNGFLLFKK